MSKKKKILFVGNCRSVHLQRWISYFKNNFDVHVISPAPCDHTECTYFEDIVPARWKWLSSIPKVGFLVRAFFLRRYLSDLDVDLIHIHFLGSFGTRIGRYIVFLRFRPFAVSTWGSDVLVLRNKRETALRRYVLQRADLVTAVCGFLAKETKKLAPGIKRLEVVPFGVDLKFFDPLRFRHKRNGTKTLRIGFFKHLKEIYCPEYLVRAFGIVSRKFSSAVLFLAGEGELRESLESLAEELGVSQKVHFLGFLEKEKVPAVMASMDITVIPSLSEGLPVAALESEALRIPVVATRVGGLPEAVEDGKTGVLVPPRNEESLAVAMIKLLSDESLRRKMGKAGRELVSSKYNWDDNAGRMSVLYTELLEKTDF